MLHRLFHAASPAPSPEPSEPSPPESPRGHIALRLPLLADAVDRAEALGARVAGGLGGGVAPAPAVLEVPATSGLRRFLGNPIGGIEASLEAGVDRLLSTAERSCTHFVCRWAGAALFAGAGLWAGATLLSGGPTLVNPDGDPHPVVGWALLVAALPVPVLPLAGAAIGEQAARLACFDLERPRRRAAAAADV